MSSKIIVEKFYKSNVFRDRKLMDSFLHPDISVEWNSSKGFLILDREGILNITDELNKTYHSSRIDITHLLEENNLVSVRYIHHIKTIENPREEMILARFMIIWELKDGKLYRGYQMSQLG
jgi:hypothetical protein